MNKVKFYKVEHLPTENLQPNSFYYVINNNYAESYITTNETDPKVRKIGNSAMIENITNLLIDEVSFKIVDNIEERNELINENIGQKPFLVLVNNASDDDENVEKGAALYAWISVEGSPEGMFYLISGDFVETFKVTVSAGETMDIEIISEIDFNKKEKVKINYIILRNDKIETGIVKVTNEDNSDIYRESEHDDCGLIFSKIFENSTPNKVLLRIDDEEPIGEYTIKGRIQRLGITF